jgi:hypothetical protein
MQKAQLIICNNPIWASKKTNSPHGEGTLRDEAKRSKIVCNIKKCAKEKHSFRQERILRQKALKIGLSEDKYLFDLIKENESKRLKKMYCRRININVI